jgi:hypothetical protein
MNDAVVHLIFMAVPDTATAAEKAPQEPWKRRPNGAPVMLCQAQQADSG